MCVYMCRQSVSDAYPVKHADHNACARLKLRLYKCMYAMAKRVACMAYIAGRTQGVCKVRVILSVYMHAKTQRVKSIIYKVSRYGGSQGEVSRF